MLKIGYYIFRAFCLLFFKKTPFTHFGTFYGGWKIPTDLLGKLEHVVGAGVGEDISFEVDLAKASNASIYLFDPTPPGINHFKELSKSPQEPDSTLINSGKKKHPADQLNQTYPALSASEFNRLTFVPLGLDQFPSQLKLALPKEGTVLSYSKEFTSSDNFILCDCMPISKLLNNELPFSKEELNLIKMDIEGSEYGVISDLLNHGIRPGVIVFEIHMFRIQNIFQSINSVIRLIYNGYRCYFMDGNNYGFIRSSSKL